ncbi:50S ribosomal protein L25 [Buchnera aphidicola str. Bp (Baizongia pistaciae)]|uniref:Large ribosomal subunit protein bL25 n=1 Tax=Buchnera aphidicola subsp. Baizongia pistaciae (strain Bp) TaxID=224915 RepID=RL25_BUCBP|nr:50S ribosomal protein L25 [Buchnera aphidicola]Q89AV5.1 RecName: Full=Large ribosomal subunit protein bL25; AltName: Full=50S ribosomal protein L25 [Buchnera aphidicola str. Bp (Baizongia pistaciae)]AAO26863.1 50S ribosomal protein L25 [Buchnera aphidicola str. Bp (Baizongia pistaciae)]
MLTIYGISRTKCGKKASRRLRLQNKFPAIIHVSLISNISIELSQNDFINIEMKNSDFYKSEVILIVDKVKYIVKIQEIQRHAFKSKILHIDFLKVSV